MSNSAPVVLVNVAPLELQFSAETAFLDQASTLQRASAMIVVKPAHGGSTAVAFPRLQLGSFAPIEKGYSLCIVGNL